MNVIIENTAKGSNDVSPLGNQIRTQFMTILDIITYNSTKEALEGSMNMYNNLIEVSEVPTHFDYGFGAAHMWVKQLDEDNNHIGERLILVHFDEE